MHQTSTGRWPEIERLFDQASALPEREQEAFLLRHCADAALRQEVSRLLSAMRASGDFLEPRQAAAADAGPTLPAGQAFGPWRIERLLGRGGMSEVYLAHRADGQYRQAAALKLLSPELAAHTAAFLKERQILATLEHPLICRLLDGGVAEDGRPFMVMEYVAGRNLLQHCDDSAAPLAERLRLFGQVCEAVAYAHRHLVVHRDLKPGNILVGADGQVKLLDFGIAKLLDEAVAPRDSGRTLHLTPRYAAPEQLRGERVSTATDSYALGVLLYELLAGAPPFDVGALPLAVAVQQVLHETPAPLSTRASTRGAAPVPPRLLRGDLDAIAAKALRKEPEARYASAAELAADLRRYQAREPVGARGYAVGYVLRRFVQRHRVLAAAAAVVAATATAAVVRIGIEADKARHERDSAQAVSDFLTQDLLGSANAWQREGKDFTVKAALDLAAQKVDERFASRPAIAARVHAMLGDTYFSLGEAAAAHRHLQQANGLFRQDGDREPGERARVLDLLASQLLSGGQHEQGCTLYAEMLELRRREFAPEHLEVLRARSRMAMCQTYAGRAEEAARAYADVLEAARRSGAPDEFVVSELQVQLAYALNDLARWEEAEPLFRQIRDYRVKTRGADHISVGVIALLLGPALYNRGRFDEAERELQEGLALVRRHVGEDQTYVPWFVWQLGLLELERGRPQAARAYLDDALARYSAAAAATGQDDAALSDLAYGIATAERDAGQPGPAAARIRTALPRTDRLSGPSHPSAIAARLLLADCLLAQHRRDEARAALAQIPDAGLQGLPQGHPLRADLRRIEGLLARAEGRNDAARAALAEALAIVEARHGASHPRALRLRAELHPPTAGL